MGKSSRKKRDSHDGKNIQMERAGFSLYRSFVKSAALLICVTAIGLALFFVANETRTSVKLIGLFSGKTTEERERIIDGDFSDFMNFCRTKIPAGEEALFYNSFERYKGVFGNNAFFNLFSDRQKSKFYLYPIRVHTVYSPDELIGSGEYSLEELLDRVRYVITAFPDRDFPGFTYFSSLDPDHRILVKKK